MTDITDDKLRGNLRGFLNRAKEAGDKRPVFQGKLTLPGDDNERGFALWSYSSEKSKESVLSGRATTSAAEQIDKLTNPERASDSEDTIAIVQKDGGDGLKLDPHALLLFTNKSKDAATPSRPDYWGYYNPGGKLPLMRLAAWTGTDRSGNAMITGNVSRDEPRRDGSPAKTPEKPKKRASAREPEDDHDELAR